MSNLFSRLAAKKRFDIVNGGLLLPNVEGQYH